MILVVEKGGILFATSMIMTTTPTTSTGCNQPSETSRLIERGNTAASQGPTNGTYRNTPAQNPHRKAWGMPIKVSPMPIASPKAALRMN